MPKILGSSLAEHRERTRTALFGALSELMSQRSFDKITLSDVANHAGVGRTAVYNHFADKEDLLLAFMEHEAGRYPASGPLSEVVSRGTAGRLKAHGALVAQMLASILTDAMDQGLIPAQEPEQVIPLIHATVMGGRPTPTDPEQRRAYLESLDAFVLRAVGARQPAHAVPTIAQPRATEPLEGAQAPGSLRHSAVG